MLSGCALDDDDAWFYPVAADDRRLPDGPILTAEEERATADLLARIEDQLAAFPGLLADWLVADLDRLAAEAAASGGRVLPGFGPVLDGGVSMVYQPYLASLDAYLSDPHRIDLAVYVGW